MDLILNKHLPYEAVAAFLEEQYASDKFFLLYPDVTEWEEMPDKSHVFQILIHDDMVGEFQYGISIFMPGDDLLPFLENLAFTLSVYFECSVVCDASRVILNQRAIYYSLLFVQGKVYLVDDRYYEDTGAVTKVVSLNYKLPDTRQKKVEMKTLPPNAVLIIIDVQKGFDDPSWGQRNNPEAEENIAKLLELWRHTNRPIFHIQHVSSEPQSPLRPNQVGCEFKDLVTPFPNEPVIQKQVNSAFIGTHLKELLDQKGFNTLVLVGLTTNHCVSTTTRMAGNFGYETYVVADATATFDRQGHDGKIYAAEEVHLVSLANLHQEFATIVNTADVLAHNIA